MSDFERQIAAVRSANNAREAARDAELSANATRARQFLEEGVRPEDLFPEYMAAIRGFLRYMAERDNPNPDFIFMPSADHVEIPDPRRRRMSPSVADILYGPVKYKPKHIVSEPTPAYVVGVVNHRDDTYKTDEVDWKRKWSRDMITDLRVVKSGQAYIDYKPNEMLIHRLTGSPLYLGVDGVFRVVKKKDRGFRGAN